jgi:hypothetical protein
MEEDKGGSVFLGEGPGLGIAHQVLPMRAGIGIHGGPQHVFIHHRLEAGLVPHDRQKQAARCDHCDGPLGVPRRHLGQEQQHCHDRIVHHLDQGSPSIGTGHGVAVVLLIAVVVV